MEQNGFQTFFGTSSFFQYRENCDTFLKMDCSSHIACVAGGLVGVEPWGRAREASAESGKASHIGRVLAMPKKQTRFPIVC